MKLLYLTTWYVREVSIPTPGAFPHEEIVDHHDFLFYRFFPQVPVRIDILGPKSAMKSRIIQLLHQGLQAARTAHQYDVVVCGGLRPGFLYLALRALGLGRGPRVVMIDFKALGHAPTNPLVLWILRWLLKTVDVLFYTSHHLEHYYRKAVPFLGEKLHYYRVGVDTSLFAPDPKVQKKNFVLVFGYESRDFATLFSAWREVIKKASDIELLVVGTRPPIPLPEKCDWRPPVTLRELNRLKQESLCVVLPIPEIPWASGHISFLETLSLGVPVIISDVLTMKDYLIDDSVYCKVPPTDAPALAEAIGKVVTDPKLRQDLAERGRRYVQEHFEERALAHEQMDVLMALGASHSS